MIKGTCGVTHTHVAGMTLILYSQSHVALPDELYKKWWVSVCRMSCIHERALIMHDLGETE